ncbi:MAG: hypothetical protein E7313_01760 [Clostridiales bacterium]|nr:hypothetical protein [Clostridiales bacterium]
MEKKKSIGSNILIIVLIFLAIASVCGGLFAWAKYQSTIQGTATGETAKWSFKVSDGDTSTQDIDFPMTRTDNNTSVAEGKIAPGTYGELEIVIDATGTETALTYVIEGTTENLPTNLKFYADENRTLDLTVLDNKFSKGGYMKLNEVGTRAETIYWEWPFETTTKPVITDEKITALGMDKEQVKTLIDERNFAKLNDMIDTAESNKQVLMSVSVTGKQLNGEPRLADLVQVGDYVNYDASNTIDGQNYSYTTESSLTGTTQGINTFTSYDEMKWRVINVDKENGIIELMSANPTLNTCTINAKKSPGFINEEIVLDNISEVYGHGYGAINARSITLQDIQKFSKYDPKTDWNNSDAEDYKNTKDYISGKSFLKEIKDDNGEVIDYETSFVEAVEGTPITMTQTTYTYIAKDYFNNYMYNMIFKDNNDESQSKQYWLASRSTYLQETICNYDVLTIENGIIKRRTFGNSSNWDSGTQLTLSVSVIVSLDYDIKTTGQDENGVWQLDI